MGEEQKLFPVAVSNNSCHISDKLGATIIRCARHPVRTKVPPAYGTCHLQAEPCNQLIYVTEDELALYTQLRFKGET